MNKEARNIKKVWLATKEEWDLVDTDYIAGYEVLAESTWESSGSHVELFLEPAHWKTDYEFLYEIRLKGKLMEVEGSRRDKLWFNGVMARAWEENFAGLLIDDSDEPDPETLIFYDMIQGEKLISSLSDYEEGGKTENDCYPSGKAIKWLKTFMARPDEVSPSRDIVDSLSSCRPKGPVKVYRGMHWSPNDRGFAPFSKAKLGKSVGHSYKRASSWTSNRSIAEYFARTMDGEPRWVIVEMTASPDDVIVDTRAIPSDIRKKLFSQNQREVVLKPGQYRAKVIMMGSGQVRVSEWPEGDWPLDPRGNIKMRERAAMNKLANDMTKLAKTVLAGTDLYPFTEEIVSKIRTRGIRWQAEPSLYDNIRIYGEDNVGMIMVNGNWNGRKVDLKISRLESEEYEGIGKKSFNNLDARAIADWIRRAI